MCSRHPLPPRDNATRRCKGPGAVVEDFGGVPNEAEDKDGDPNPVRECCKEWSRGVPCKHLPQYASRVPPFSSGPVHGAAMSEWPHGRAGVGRGEAAAPCGVRPPDPGLTADPIRPPAGSMGSPEGGPSQHGGRGWAHPCKFETVQGREKFRFGGRSKAKIVGKSLNCL